MQAKKQKGQAVLETYGELALGPYADLEIGRATKLPPDKIVEALQDVLKESNTSTVDCAVAIPMKSSMVSVIKIPTLDEKQLPKMIPLEARKYIPTACPFCFFACTTFIDAEPISIPKTLWLSFDKNDLKKSLIANSIYIAY